MRYKGWDSARGVEPAGKLRAVSSARTSPHECPGPAHPSKDAQDIEHAAAVWWLNHLAG